MSRDLGSIDPDVLREAATLATATLHEAAGQVGALPAAIKPIASGVRVCGPAFTVAAAPVDNLWIHRGLAEAAPDAILVVTVDGAYEAGYWGDVMTSAAMARGLGGLVIDGCVRDRRELRDSGFPIFARGVSIRGTAKVADAPGSVGASLRVGDVVVRPGDLIVGDDDGVVVLPREDLPGILRGAQARIVKEAEVIGELRRGRTTLEIYGWE